MSAEHHDEAVKDSRQTGCIVVGGGPAGVILSLLLARRGVEVTLLEAHKDFDRDFRGDTIHPSTLEILDELGLADRLLTIPHGKIHALQVYTPKKTTTIGDLRSLNTKFPFIALMAQAKLLDFLIEECRKYPSFHLEMGANVQRLVQEDGTVKGVRYRGSDDAWHEIRAPLTVACDGRFSKVRSILGLEPVKSSPPMDILWFRLPHLPSDPDDQPVIRTHDGRFVVLLDRGDEWQFGYAILKGNYAQIKAAGIQNVREPLRILIPWMGERIDTIQDFKQITVLSVESNRLTKWYQPGVLLIGDAAHVMSPVGGVGISYAVQDAVETANLLADKLKQGTVTVDDLAEVQRVREFPVKVIQRFQTFLQENLARPALTGKADFELPLLPRILLKIPFLNRIPTRMIGFGIRKVHVKQ